MKTRISPRDIEALSAYLDGQLAPREKARLEARLQDDTQLQIELQNLSRIRTVIRSQPKLRAPRNFTLSPQTAGIKAGGRPVSGAFPVLRLAALLASAFFVLILVGDLFTRSMQPVPITLSRSVDQVAAPIVPPVGMGGGGGGGDGNVPPAPAAVEEAAVATEAPAAEKAVAVEPATAEASNLAATPLGFAPIVTPTVAPTQAPLEAQAIMPAVSPEATFTQTIVAEGLALVPATPVPEQPALPESVSADEQVTSEAPEQEATIWLGGTVLRILEITLLLLAVVAGVAAFYTRRASRG